MVPTTCSNSFRYRHGAPVVAGGDAIRDEQVKVLRSVRPLARPTWCADSRTGKTRPLSRRADVARLATRRSWRAARHRELALGRRAVLPAHRKGWTAVIPDRHPVSPVPECCSAITDRGLRGETSWCCGIQPEEAFPLRIGAKVPGDVRLGIVTMDFDYARVRDRPSTRYERCCTMHDRRPDAVPARRHAERLERGGPIQAAWRDRARWLDTSIPRLAPGAADELLVAMGRLWREAGRARENWLLPLPVGEGVGVRGKRVQRPPPHPNPLPKGRGEYARRISDDALFLQTPVFRGGVDDDVRGLMNHSKARRWRTCWRRMPGQLPAAVLAARRRQGGRCRCRDTTRSCSRDRAEERCRCRGTVRPVDGHRQIFRNERRHRLGTATRARSCRGEQEKAAQAEATTP